MTQDAPNSTGVRLAQFIQNDIELILAEWESFARSLPPGATMSVLDLRDHAKEVLLAIAMDMDTAQAEVQRSAKSKGQRSRSAPRKRPPPSTGLCGRSMASI